MTTTSTASPLSGTTGKKGSWLRRNTGWIGFALLLAALVTYVLVDRQAATGDNKPLSPNNPSPNGAMAVATILEEHGVTVTSTDNLASAQEALDKHSDSTLFLYDARGFLGSEQLAELKDSAARIVVVAPRFGTLRTLAPDIRPSGVVPGSVRLLEPECSNPDARAAGAVKAEGTVFTGPDVCYPVRPDGPGLVAASGDKRVIVLGSTGLLDNEHLVDEGNAALSIRTLGSNGHLVWYLPGIADIAPDKSTPTLGQLAPPWVGVAGPWLALVAILAIAWRGRRLGPLAHEPMPVVVKAAETAEGRARLYQDSRAVERAADNLRAGALSRLAKHFNLGAGASADAVVEALERHLGRPVPELRSTALDSHPRSEQQLVLWAQEIDRIEQEAIAQ
ncbi:DUF4350 domain-containing protein [Paenarthrobacter sp. NPDC089675]|uniref:DUF4350 domain-containing protein n=1 Tax=Paenarthrobacter sp. NPDC089675 TaxID=3364376 RepID=UPI00380E2998